MVREFRGRERAVGHEHREDFGTRLVADERGNACNVGTVPHRHMVAGDGRGVAVTLRWRSKHSALPGG